MLQLISIWNPKKDLIIPEKYSVKNFYKGKNENKRYLVQKMGLESVEKPVISMCVRLSEQKGIKMLSECIEPVLNTMETQLVIMGQGEKWASDYFSSLPKKYPGKIAVELYKNNKGDFNKIIESFIIDGIDKTMNIYNTKKQGLYEFSFELF